MPFMPAKPAVDELRNCFAVSYAFSVKSEIMKSASKRSCNARRDWKRFSYSVTCPEAPNLSMSLVRLIVVLRGDDDKPGSP
jgi:hypothetical protein